MHGKRADLSLLWLGPMSSRCVQKVCTLFTFHLGLLHPFLVCVSLPALDIPAETLRRVPSFVSY